VILREQMSEVLAQLDDVDRGMAGLEEGQARSVQECGIHIMMVILMHWDI